MGFLLDFDLLGMYRHSRQFHPECIHEESYSEKDERDAQKLSHIKGHILLEINLRFLDEFYEESHPETYDKENPYECAPIDLVKLLDIQPKKEKPENQIAERFIKLSRMFGFGFTPEVKHESPRKSSDVSVYLRIEKVSKTDECRSESHSDAKMVKQPHEIEVLSPAIMLGEP